MHQTGKSSDEGQFSSDAFVGCKRKMNIAGSREYMLLFWTDDMPPIQQNASCKLPNATTKVQAVKEVFFDIRYQSASTMKLLYRNGEFCRADDFNQNHLVFCFICCLA